MIYFNNSKNRENYFVTFYVSSLNANAYCLAAVSIISKSRRYIVSTVEQEITLLCKLLQVKPKMV